MNTPQLETARLILRRFTENDVEALYLILADKEVNTFLPWFPVKSIEEAQAFFEERYASIYKKPQAYAYAVCLKEDDYPIGYIKVDMDESHDFGYGLRKEFWHRGIITEAGKAVIAQVKKDGLPYITATHDINNPRSGGVMRQVGMRYQYSYEEQWQPKDFPVTFRMYQLNFEENDHSVFKKYWDNSNVHFVEALSKNYYGSLCTKMYEILHEKAPADELQFYLSYAEKSMRILEPLCGSGRFLVPFLERGFDISGMDMSEEMLSKLRQKAPGAKVTQTDIVKYSAEERFDYIFIPSGSISLFTDLDICREILRKMKELLKPGGKFVFAVDTVFDRCADNSDYKTSVSVKTKEGFDLVLKGKNYYDEKSQTQFSPSIYELYNGSELLQSENMDFQTHLYRYGEMEQYLRECGFKNILTYSNYEKEIAVNDECEILIYECRI